MNLVQNREDQLRAGGVLSAALTVPTARANDVVLRGCGDLLDEIRLDPGEHLAFIPGFAGFPGAGVILDVPAIADDQTTLLFGGRLNAFVNQGLQRLLDLFFEDTQASLQGVSHIGLSADAQAVTASTTSADPAGGATGTSIKTVSNVSRTAQTTHGDQTWTEADVSWAIRKIAFFYGAFATDVINIIGGSGGSSPYDEDFTIDLVSVPSWSLTMGIDVTAIAS